MIFAILILAVFGAVAFFHYTQGFFSATLSVVLAAVAACVAVSYHETIVNSFLQGKFSDSASAITLVVTFAVTYLVLRVIFDSLVPGNIRLPLLVDKIGAGVMGVLAGLLAGGLVALSAQMLPFAPTIAGYGRYETVDERPAVVIGRGQSQDAPVYDELKEEKFDPAKEKGLFIPADDVVVGFVSLMSGPGGAFEGERSLKSVHPNWQEELFADRLGIQTGAKRTALAVGSRQQVKVAGVYVADQLTQHEGELKDIRSTQRSGTVKSNAQEVLLVVRTMIDHDATDSDGLFRFSPATMRLIVDGKIYYPIGTLEGTDVVLVNRLDDPLVMDVGGGEKGVDLVYQLPRNAVLAAGEKDPTAVTVKEGAVLQVKRLARVSLSGAKVGPSVPASSAVAVLRKESLAKQFAPAEAGPGTPLQMDKATAGGKFFTAINVGTPDADVKDQQLNSGVVTLKEKKFAKMDINATDTLQKMRQGGYPVSELWAPDGKVVVQVQARPAGDQDKAWDWADQVGKFELVDANKQRYKPTGAFVSLKMPQGVDKMVGQYNAEGQVTSVAKGEGRPTDVYVTYAVPKGTQLRQWDYEGKKVKDLDVKAE